MTTITRLSQSELIRYFQTLDTTTDYRTLLVNNFNLDLPSATPKYMLEYMLKACTEQRSKGVSEEEIFAKAEIQVAKLISNFPWVTKKYDEVIASTKDIIQEVADEHVEISYKMPVEKEVVKKSSVKRIRRVPVDVADGTIEYYITCKTYQLFIGGKEAIICRDINKLKANALDTLNFSDFKGVFTFVAGVATEYTEM